MLEGLLWALGGHGKSKCVGGGSDMTGFVEGLRETSMEWGHQFRALISASRISTREDSGIPFWDTFSLLVPMVRSSLGGPFRVWGLVDRGQDPSIVVL